MLIPIAILILVLVFHKRLKEVSIIIIIMLFIASFILFDYSTRRFGYRLLEFIFGGGKRRLK